MRKVNLLFTALDVFGVTAIYAQPKAGIPSKPGTCYTKRLIQDQNETISEQF